MKNYIYVIDRRGVIISDVPELFANDWLSNNVIPGREKWHDTFPFEVNNKGPTTKYFQPPLTLILWRDIKTVTSKNKVCISNWTSKA